jgi:hypothetical protein
MQSERVKKKTCILIISKKQTIMAKVSTSMARKEAQLKTRLELFHDANALHEPPKEAFSSMEQGTEVTCQKFGLAGVRDSTGEESRGGERS